jgi:hypothetical protein
MYVRNLAVQPAVFRRSAWEAVGGYWGGFSSSGIEDWDLWIRILQSGLQAEVIPAVVWEYRIRPGQMSGTMFHPERWKTLTHELAVRHAAGYAAHAPMIFAGQQMEWAKLRAWANSLRTGVDFWRGQATGWQALATEHESMIEELRRWIDELETAKAWWQMQSEEWRRIAQSRNA